MTRRGHFAMVAAVQAHLGALALSKWIISNVSDDSDETDNTVERARLADWFGEILEDPLTLDRVDHIVAAVT